MGDWENDGTVRILVAAGSTLRVIDLAGTETSSVPLPGRFALIECGRNKAKGTRLPGYNTWGKEVAVMDHAGKQLWKVDTTSGVDGAHWGDLDGDGTDELVVGMNGGGGLSTWSAEGSQMWSTSLGNVWNQAIVPATANQPALVLATEAGGSVKVFDAHGKLQQTLKPNGGYYAQMAAGRIGDKGIQIVGINGNKTVAFDAAGKVAWTTSAIGNHAGWRGNSFASGDLKGDGSLSWAFIDGSGNLVIATAGGQKLSSIPNAKELTGYAFAARPGKAAFWSPWAATERSKPIASNIDHAAGG